ncbi:mCG1025104, partial [Mus musculus]
MIVLVLFVLIYGLCYCLKLCVEAVKTGQKILIEQQESMSEKEKG